MNNIRKGGEYTDSGKRFGNGDKGSREMLTVLDENGKNGIA